MSRKTLIFIVIIIAILILGLGIYLLFFTKPLISPTNPNSGYSPFGNYTGSSTTTPSNPNTSNSTSTDNAVTYTNSPTSPLIRISTAPIAGTGSFQRKIATNSATTTTIARYTERATGHTMDYDLTSNKLTNSSNTTIPTIYRAWWSGSSLLAQFLDKDGQTTKTYAGNLPITSTSTLSLSGSFLANDIYNLAISPKGNRIFYLQAGDSAVGTVSNIDGTKRNQIFTFPFNEWVTQWPNESTITLTTKASSNVAGFMYFLSSATGAMTKALGNIYGLTTRTSPSLNYTIYSAGTDNGILTAVYDLKKDTSYAFNNPTLAEKCVWSTLNKTVAYCAVPTSIPNGNYPDSWYQGNVSFTDNIYKIDMSLPAVQLLYNLPQNQNIDAINLSLDQKEKYLFFTNKNDYYLWGLNLTGLIPKM